MRRRRPKGGQRSLRKIAAELAACGIMNERGRPFLREVQRLDAQQMKDPPRLKNLSGSCVFYVRGDDE